MFLDIWIFIINFLTRSWRWSIPPLPTTTHPHPYLPLPTPPLPTPEQFLPRPKSTGPLDLFFCILYYLFRKERQAQLTSLPVSSNQPFCLSSFISMSYSSTTRSCWEWNGLLSARATHLKFCVLSIYHWLGHYPAYLYSLLKTLFTFWIFYKLSVAIPDTFKGIHLST